MEIISQLSGWVPFLQSLLWVTVIVAFAVCFRSNVRVIVESIAKRCEAGASVEIGPLKLRELRRDLDVVQRRVDDISNLTARLFLTTMSKPMYGNLTKLCDGFGSYVKNGGLKRELYHLRDIGYVDIESIGGIPIEGRQLSDYVTVTEAGRGFVRLRRQVETSIAGA